jgi:hypothetical protein
VEDGLIQQILIFCHPTGVQQDQPLDMTKTVVPGESSDKGNYMPTPSFKLQNVGTTDK